MLRATIFVGCIQITMAIHMISSAQDDCLTKLNELDTENNFQPLGAGGNAIVLQYTGEELTVKGQSKKKQKTCMNKNAIVKVYDDISKEAADEQLKFFTDSKLVGKSEKPLLQILDKCGAAAMPKYCVDEPELCLFQAKCPKKHVPEDLETVYTSEMCWYLVLLSGGEKTLEQCFQTDESMDDYEFLLLMKKATEISQCFHEENLVHGDFQLKNIMTNACSKTKDKKSTKDKPFNPIVQAVDLDGVIYAPDSVDQDKEYYAKGSFKAYRQDLRLFIGAENSGGFPLTHWERIKNSKAAEEIMQWSDENLPSSPDDNQWSWQALYEIETNFREELDGMLEESMPESTMKDEKKKSTKKGRKKVVVKKKK